MPLLRCLLYYFVFKFMSELNYLLTIPIVIDIFYILIDLWRMAFKKMHRSEFTSKNRFCYHCFHSGACLWTEFTKPIFLFHYFENIYDSAIYYHNQCMTYVCLKKLWMTNVWLLEVWIELTSSFSSLKYVSVFWKNWHWIWICFLKKSQKRNHKTALRKILTLLPARTSKRRQ